MHTAGADTDTLMSATSAWERAAACEREPDFQTAMAALVNDYPTIRQYIADTFPVGHCYADYALNHITTLGCRTTARVEAWNSVLKGMLEVDSHTPLTVLFDSLRYALSDKDYRAYKRALADDARRPVVTQARTIDAETAPHLTYYAQCIVKAQAGLCANYRYDMVQAANPAIFNVCDRRAAQQDEVRQVAVTETTMQCTCGFPRSYLLPCRHVLVVNNHIYNMQFRVAQVGLRWLRAHMPAVRLQPAPASLQLNSPPDLPVPSFASGTATSVSVPSQKARYAQLMGWFTTIASIATEAGHLYAYTANRAEAFCKEVEAMVAHRALPHNQRPATTVTVCVSDAPAAVLSELHPTMPAEQMQMASHRKRARGRATEKRKQSAVELAMKGMHTSLFTASQSV